MAIIYDTTMSPGKLELLAAWLPVQPWYLGTGHEPELAKAGGFRLDDPHGEVGIEFMVVSDRSGGRATTYQVPLTYRARALASAGGLIGTAEHGVLGHRWIYDGAHDPVLVAQLVAGSCGPPTGWPRPPGRPAFPATGGGPTAHRSAASWPPRSTLTSAVLHT